MPKVTVESGVCNFRTEIKAEAWDFTHCHLEIETNCPNIKKIASRLDGDLNPFDEISFKKSHLHSLFVEYSPHAACPVLSGMVKAIEVAAGLALPKDAHIFVEK